MGAWKACEEEGVALDPALPVAVGIDVGITRDASAVVIAQKQGDNIIVESKVWVNPYPKDSAMGMAWQVDIEEIRRYLVTLKDRFPAPMVKIDGRTRPGPAFCYDPWSFRESAQMLEGEGLAMVETNQTDSRMVPMTADLFQAIVTRRLRYDSKTNVALTRHVMAAVAVPRGDAGWRIRKPRGSTTAKVDAAIAMVMAVSQAMQPPPRRAFTGMIA
jgi:phage terminase large subunit-like protein